MTPPPTTATTTPIPLPTEATSGTTSGTTTETTSGSDSSSDDDPTVDPCACMFLCPPCPEKGCPGYDPDCGAVFECDIWEQDCPEGEKCMPWSNDGGPAWNATRCSPVDPNPDQVGAPCIVEGNGQSGVDTCDISQMCFDVDPDDNGTCVGFCGGTEKDPVCPETFACSISNGGTLALCLPTCDPLLPTCPEGDGCFPTDVGESFVCLPAPNESIDIFWTCHTTGGCEPGTICLDSSFLPACDDDECCTPYCNVASPMCPIDTECLSFWDEGAVPPPGFEDVGVCAVP